MAKAKGSTKAKDSEEELELEDLDETVEEDEEPAKKSKAQEVTFGVADIVAHVASKGVKTSTREVRTLIRKMAREDKPRVEREITAGNRTRYDWPKGLKDPEVKAIIAAITGGEMEADKKAKLEQLKTQKAEKASKKAGKAGKGKKGKGKVVESDEEEEIEEVDVEDDD